MSQTTMERKTETGQKLTNLRLWMDTQKLEVVVLRRTASIAWITAGATDYVNTATSEGPLTAVITATRAVAILNSIEAPRFRDEEHLEEFGWEIAEFPWFDGAAAPTPASITGKILEPEWAAADVPFPGARNITAEISRLRSVLLPSEQQRYRQLGAECAQAMEEAAMSVQPGQSEYRIAGQIAAAAQPRGIQAVVNLVATDQRMRHYRHPLPTGKVLEKHALLVLCGRRDGLVASVSRIVHFGTVPDEIRRAQEAVAYVDAVAIGASLPGEKLGEVFRQIQEAYDTAGFPQGWHGHHQGGVAAYEPREYLGLPGSTDTLQKGMICAWNPSLPGAKSEDSVMVGTGPDGAAELLTATPSWPVIKPGDGLMPRAGILIR